MMAEARFLVGMDEQVHLFARSVRGGRAHHAWLLHGPSGLGKSRFALHMANWLLLGAGDQNPAMLDPEHPITKRLINGSHGGAMVLRRIADEKGKLASFIDVASVRKLGEFFALSSGEGGHRIVIIDSVDEMNRNAANALLKNLEEPPARCTFFLVCHQRSAILPTILSRCASLGFTPLNDGQMQSALKGLGDVTPEQIAFLTALSRGRPGLAMQIQEEGLVDLLAQLNDILSSTRGIDVKRARSLAEALSGTGKEKARALFADLFLSAIARRARSADQHQQLAWSHLHDEMTARFHRMGAQHLDVGAALSELIWHAQKQARGLNHAD
jgi:DNA polymerase III subunit delta'